MAAPLQGYNTCDSVNLHDPHFINHTVMKCFLPTQHCTFWWHGSCCGRRGLHFYACETKLPSPGSTTALNHVKSRSSGKAMYCVETYSNSYISTLQLPSWWNVVHWEQLDVLDLSSKTMIPEMMHQLVPWQAVMEEWTSPANSVMDILL